MSSKIIAIFSHHNVQCGAGTLLLQAARRWLSS
jgi:hypothetical protein